MPKRSMCISQGSCSAVDYIFWLYFSARLLQLIQLHYKERLTEKLMSALLEPYSQTKVRIYCNCCFQSVKRLARAPWREARETFVCSPSFTPSC